jgi:hypothetical protein
MILTPQLKISNERILSGMQAGAYDFADIGTCGGGGFEIARLLGGRRGVGFELDPNLTQRSLDSGLDVMCQDVRTLPAGIKGIRFAVCSHILEHIPNIYDVGALVSALSELCSDYLIISGPNFDTEEFLYSRGLKVLHSAMDDHLCKFKTIDLIQLLYGLGLRDFVIGLSEEMRDSNSVWIHRADAAPEGLFMWNHECLPKPFVNFDAPLHRDIVCVIKLNPKVDTDAILRDFRWKCDKVIFRSMSKFEG